MTIREHTWELDWEEIDRSVEGGKADSLAASLMHITNKLFSKQTAPNRWIEAM